MRRVLTSRNIILSAVLLGLVSVTLVQVRQGYFDREPLFSISSYESGTTKVSFKRVVKDWSERGVDLYLPTSLPDGLKPAGVWVAIKDGEIGGLAVFLYSAKFRGRVATAEIAFEVSPMAGIPFDPKDSKGTFTKINGWDVYYDENAPCYWADYKKYYGTTDSSLVNVQIGNLNYNFRGEPSITIEDMLKIVETMKPATKALGTQGEG